MSPTPQYDWQPEQSELRTAIEECLPEMRDGDLYPRDWEVTIFESVEPDSGDTELWANIWFELEPNNTLDTRREQAMEVLKRSLKDHTHLPLVVNANYQTDVVDDGIACWWSA